MRFNNRIIPVCLPKTWMQNEDFRGRTVQISGYGQVEKFTVEGNQNKRTNLLTLWFKFSVFIHRKRSNFTLFKARKFDNNRFN